MNDNVVNFPSREDVSEEDLEEHNEVVESVRLMLDMHVHGIINTSEIDWVHVMDACFSLGILAGLRSGATTSQLEDILHSAELEEVVYDA